MDGDGVDAVGVWAIGEAAIGGVIDTRTAEHSDCAESVSLIVRLNIRYRSILSYLWSRMARNVANWTKTKRNW